MKNITVVDYNGITYEGEWNGKTYTSQVLGREDLYRMYVSNEAIHITKEELKKYQMMLKEVTKRLVMAF